MANNNTVTLTGNLGQAPETYSNDKGEFIVLSLATTDSYKNDKSGEWNNKLTIWHTVFAFGPNVKGYAKTFRKGDRVKVTGALSYRTTIEMIEGEQRYFTNATIVANRIEDARLPKKGA